MYICAYRPIGTLFDPEESNVAIDLTHEKLITLGTAAHTLPGGPVHVSTIHRWRMKGARGIKLETVLRGGVRFTSPEALERFFAATTARAAGEPAPTPQVTLKQRNAAFQKAESILDQARI